MGARKKLPGLLDVVRKSARLYLAFLLMFFVLLYGVPLFGMHRSNDEQRQCAGAPISRQCRSALDPNVWSSAAWVTFPRENMTIDEKMHERPLLCEFENVYITAAHVYFVPRPNAFQKAANDISRCCGLGSSASDCNASVHRDLCFCFYNAKYVAFAWAGHSNETVHLHLPGHTWVMHHWSVARHPDHFSMKILELHGLVAASATRRRQHANVMPSEFDNLLSMDYPGPFSEFTSTSYETFLYDILQRQTKPKQGYYFLNLEGAPLYDRLFQPGISEALRSELHTVQPSHIPHLRVAHVERAYLSPRYKNNLPEPVNISISALQHTFRSKVVGVGHRSCVDKLEPRRSIAIALLYRDEGSGLRRFVNANDMLLSIRRVVKEPEIKVWFISSTTPALDQAVMFCSFHILISPHSSQLSNLVFTPFGLSVIEIQNEELVENTFAHLGRKMHLHYQLLKTGNHPPIHGSYAKTSDVVVNITAFETALANAVRSVRLQGYLQ